jgi:uncharacterized membrane protein (DUF441 family)
MMDINSLMNNSIVLVPLILAVVQGVKLIAPNLSRWAPLISILIGIIFSWLFATGDEIVTLKTVLAGGVLAGLSASGLYSGLATTMKSDIVDTERLD